jgi:hypothetical protein
MTLENMKTDATYAVVSPSHRILCNFSDVGMAREYLTRPNISQNLRIVRITTSYEELV